MGLGKDRVLGRWETRRTEVGIGVAQLGATHRIAVLTPANDWIALKVSPAQAIRRKAHPVGAHAVLVEAQPVHRLVAQLGRLYVGHFDTVQDGPAASVGGQDVVRGRALVLDQPQLRPVQVDPISRGRVALVAWRSGLPAGREQDLTRVPQLVVLLLRVVYGDRVSNRALPRTFPGRLRRKHRGRVLGHGVEVLVETLALRDQVVVDEELRLSSHRHCP